MSGRIWLSLAAILVVAGIAVPYGPLAGQEGSLAVPLFWFGFGVAVIALIVAGVARWKVTA